MVDTGECIGSYRLVEKFERGTCGCAYRGEHTIFSDTPPIVIKVLPLDPLLQEDQFFQELRLLRKLKHPHILPLLDAGTHQGSLYLLFEYAPNGSLRDRLNRQPGNLLPVEEALPILAQVGEALHHAHQENFVHRNLKPENILFAANGEVLVADFGMAKILTTTAERRGSIIGTPAYMAPEQFRGMISKESDQYALACIAYELFTGQKPFTAPDLISMGFKHLMEQPAAPTQLNPGLPVHIQQAVLKAMSKVRTERFSDIAAFIRALQKNKEQWLDEGYMHYNAKRYEEALTALEEAIRLDPNYAKAHYSKGNTLRELKRYQEALAAYDRAIQLNPGYAKAYSNKGIILHNLKRYDDALLAYNHAIQLDPSNALAYHGKATVLGNLKRYDDALVTFDCAIQLNPNMAFTYYNKGVVLEYLGWTREAQQAYEKARQLGYSG